MTNIETFLKTKEFTPAQNAVAKNLLLEFDTFRLINSNNYCCICGNELTEHEKQVNDFDSYTCNTVCENHSHLREVFDLPAFLAEYGTFEKQPQKQGLI